VSPRVSVIVPSYNHASYLRQCLESVLAQDFEDFEIVLVDDVSKDESVEVARSFKDKRLQVHLNEQNLGTYATQNRALDLARGEFVAVLNSDDLWRPGKLRRQMDLWAKHPEAKLCYTLGEQIDPDGKVMECDQHLHWPREEIQDLFPFLLSSNRLLASSVMFRRGELRFEESLRYSGDWVGWLTLAENGKMVCVDRALTAWRQHPTNSYTRSQRVTLEEIRVRKAILSAQRRWLKARPGKTAEIRKALSDCAVDLTALYVLIGHMRLAKTAAGLALRLAPASSAAHKRLAISLMPAILARRHLWSSERLKVSRAELKQIEPLELI
jgi:glycosyltransferase involved in cell wall biosynthesis